MSKEIPLQKDMFSDELVDTRNRAQKSRDRISEQFQQVSMFSTRETVQLGVSLRPWLKDMERPTMTLEILDMRTEEEKERERRREAEALTTPLFSGHEVVSGNGSMDKGQSEAERMNETKVVSQVDNLRQIGFRAYARRTSIPVRWKAPRTSGQIVSAAIHIQV